MEKGRPKEVTGDVARPGNGFLLARAVRVPVGCVIRALLPMRHVCMVYGWPEAVYVFRGRESGSKERKALIA